MCAIGLVLLFLLMQATNNRELYERHYAWLFGLNVLVAAVLALVLLWMAVRLAVRWKQRRVWQPPALQAGSNFWPGWSDSRLADLPGVLPVCLSLYRELV